MAEPKIFFIVTERRERIVVRRRPTAAAPGAFCRKCGRNVEWLTLSETLDVTGRTTEEIRDALEDGILDFQLTDEGLLYICRGSVSKAGWLRKEE